MFERTRPVGSGRFRSILRATAASVLCLAPITLGTPLHALAQAVASNPDTPDSGAKAAAVGTQSDDLAEIVVTAQKQRESINKVGMSITAVSGNQLQALGVTDVSGLTKIEPSFVVSTNPLGPPVYTIRGIGYNDWSLAAAPDVSVYLDEVPFAYTSMSKGAPFDLEQVEVLKGPQGTLYGQNSTGGAVNYIAAKPTDTLKAGLSDTFGRFNVNDLTGFVSGPLAETLTARLAFNVTEGDAWQHSDTRDDQLGTRDQKKARAILDWTPSDDLKVSLTANGFTDNSETQAGQLVRIVYGNAKYASRLPQDAAEPIAPANAQAADWNAGTHPANDEKFYQVSLRAEYSVSDALHLTYVGGYSKYLQNDLEEPSGVDTAFNLNLRGNVDSISQELRANGKLLNEKLDWMVGLDYARTRAYEDQHDIFTGTTSSFAFTPLGAPPFTYLDNVSTDTSDSKAVFGRAEYHLSDTLDVHGALRYTKTDIDHVGCSLGDPAFSQGITAFEANAKHGAQVVPAVVGGCATLSPPPSLTPSLFTGKLDQNNVSWRTGIDWTPIEGTLLYASISKGYKAGSFPTLSAQSTSQLTPVTQESVLAYETGFKSRLFENRLELDGAAFYYDYTNKQIQARIPAPVFNFLSALVNVPKSQVTGAEWTVKVRPMSGLTLSGAATWLESSVTDHFISNNPFVNAPLDLKGEPLPNTPKWAARIGAEYLWDINAEWYATFGIDGEYQGKSPALFGVSSAVQQGFPSLEIGSRALLNLRASIDSNDGHWHFEAFGENVTNAFYETSVVRNSDFVTRYAGMPVTYGLTVGYRY